MEWIKTTERLPENYNRVLIYKREKVLISMGTAFFINGKFLFEALAINDSKYFENVSDQIIKGVTHWSELTPPEQ